MRGPLHSNSLVPFKKRREAYHLPGGQDGACALERLDPGLSAEEQSYVRRYLSYADALLEKVKESIPSSRGRETSRRGGAAWQPAKKKKETSREKAA